MHTVLMMLLWGLHWLLDCRPAVSLDRRWTPLSFIMDLLFRLFRPWSVELLDIGWTSLSFMIDLLFRLFRPWSVELLDIGRTAVSFIIDVVVVQTDRSSHGRWSSWTGGGHLSADHAEEEHSQAVSCQCRCLLCCWLSACFVTLQGSLPRKRSK